MFHLTKDYFFSVIETYLYYGTGKQSWKGTDTYLFTQDAVRFSSSLPAYTINTAMCYDPLLVPLDSDLEEDDEEEDSDKDSYFGNELFN